MSEKSKRPKVRYVATEYGLFKVDSRKNCVSDLGEYVLGFHDHTRTMTKRIAAALNWHEALKRGEL